VGSNAVAEKTMVSAVNADRVEGYGPVMGSAAAITAMGILVTAVLGPEKMDAKFEQAKPAGTAEIKLMRRLDPEAGADKATQVPVEVAPARE
jgi:hypothetical protein